MVVVQLSDYRKPVQKRKKVLPFNKKYPMPFFKKRDRGGINAWNVTPTGNYSADCDTGRAYATEFLMSCDGTYGWQSLLPSIVADMICAGTDGQFPDGHPKINGVVIGFMGIIGSAVTHSKILDYRS